MTDLIAPTLAVGSTSQHTLMEQMYHVDQAFHHLGFILQSYAPQESDYTAETHDEARTAWFERIQKVAAMRTEFRVVARATALQKDAA